MLTLVAVVGLCVLSNGSPQNPQSHEPSAPAERTTESPTETQQNHDSAIDTGINARNLDLEFFMPATRRNGTQAKNHLPNYQFTIPQIGVKPDYPGNFTINQTTPNQRSQNQGSTGQRLSNSSQIDIKNDQNGSDYRNSTGSLTNGTSTKTYYILQESKHAIDARPLSTFKFEDLPSFPERIRNDYRLSKLSHSPTARLQAPAGALDAALSAPRGGYVSISRTPVSTFWVDDLRVFRPNLERLAAPPEPTGSLKYIERPSGTAETDELGYLPSFEDRKPEATGKERLPWQVSVFSKHKTPYVRVCGGSLVSRTAVVSAAHCFWGRTGRLSPDQFVLGAGEVLRDRMDDLDSHQYHKEIYVILATPGFSGSTGSLGDIAVLLITTTYLLPGLRPLCLSFDTGLEERQLVAGSSATVLGIGLEKEKNLTVLERLEVPYIAPEACGRVLDREMLGNLTGDKMCAGFKPGSSPALGKICSVDAGTGLAFFLGSPQDLARGIGVPYLRGVASVLPPECGARAVTLYTRVRDHRTFLEGILGDSLDDCDRHYPQAASFLDEKRQIDCNCSC